MKQYIPYIVILILLYIISYQCNRIIITNQLSASNNKVYSDSVSYYKNKLGTQTAAVNTLQMDTRQLREIILKKDVKLSKLAKEFASVKHIVKSESYFSLDTIARKLDVPIITDSIHFERRGKIESEWYSLVYKISNDSLVISPFRTWTETTVITGLKRKWFLGKETIVTDITNSNPHIMMKDIKAVEVVVHQPWYRKWYVWLAAGIAGGVLSR